MISIYILSVIEVVSTTIFNPSDYKPRKNDYEDNLRNELDYMKNYNGLYPNKVKLLGNNLLTKRLKNLIKDRYSFLVKTWAVETPIEIKNSMFSAWGCQQHNCSNTNFIIVVDFKKNVVYVGIREEENVKIYSEDGSSNILVNNWAKRIS